MERGYIANSQIKSPKSQHGYRAPSGRLGHDSSWCFKNPGRPFLEVNLDRLHTICAIATQGEYDGTDYVAKYHLQFSQGGDNWESYQNPINGKKVGTFHVLI